MRNPYLITGVLSIALWITIREQAFDANATLAWVATIVLLGWGGFGIFSTLKKKPDQD
ncbi:MAG: hypothetical protein QNK56_06480 [Pontimonas sp.]|jgi:hypothetical protein|tara:strand:- start:1966 stop:2139 length:174 start_codon:yes stop_codon:yes gene_type:complete